jgi:hypothetical protein
VFGCLCGGLLVVVCWFCVVKGYVGSVVCGFGFCFGGFIWWWFGWCVGGVFVWVVCALVGGRYLFFLLWGGILLGGYTILVVFGSILGGCCWVEGGDLFSVSVFSGLFVRDG